MTEMETQAHRTHDRSVSEARELSGASSTPANAVIAAQQSVGNQAVQRELRAGSGKLALGQQATVGNQRVQRLLRRRPVPSAPGRSLQRVPATHHVYEPLDRRPRGRSRIVEGATLRQRIANAEAAGYEVIRQRRIDSRTRETQTHVYARIPRYEPLTRQQTLEVNGVSITVRNASEAEAAALQRTLALVPAPHLTALAERRRAIVLVDWTGAPNPNQRRLSGGANIERARDSTTRHHARYPEDDIGEPAGSRIEITHSSMLDGGRATLLHEIGHVVYSAGLIPRRVHREDYGSSVHTGESEQPAYAYMRFLQGGTLDPRDRAAFVAAFRAQGAPLPHGPGAPAPAAEGEAQRQLAASAPSGPQFQARPATIQRSPLSNAVARIWDERHHKGTVFDMLRSHGPARDDADLAAVLARIFAAGSDDLWLARQIKQHGAEPLWPAAAIEERGRRARQHRWADEPGYIQARLATSAGQRPITAYFFPGRTDERALVISGIHGSELSGIQVVEQLLERLRTGPRPYYTVIIVPRLFPDNAALAESRPSAIGTRSNVGRNTDEGNPTNRQYPGFGRAFDPSNPVDDRGQRMETETIALLTLIDRFRPSRIASVHATHTLENAGIYADPRTAAPVPGDSRRRSRRGLGFAGQALGFAEDERLSLAMAGHARGRGANVPGNELGTPSPTAIYPRDPEAVSAGELQPRNVEEGVSGGGWLATEVRDPDRPERNRPAMTTITVEVQTSRRVEDVAAGEQPARRREIEAHASALREIFLGPPR